jgi:hypothetical protein
MTTDAELSRLTTAAPSYVVTGEKILELAKTAHFRYAKQSPAEQRRLLDIVLSNCTFDRGTLCPTYLGHTKRHQCSRGARWPSPRRP